jgi:hypothetical protein
MDIEQLKEESEKARAACRIANRALNEAHKNLTMAEAIGNKDEISKAAASLYWARGEAEAKDKDYQNLQSAIAKAIELNRIRVLFECTAEQLLEAALEKMKGDIPF